MKTEKEAKNEKPVKVKEEKPAKVKPVKKEVKQENKQPQIVQNNIHTPKRTKK